MSTSISKRWIGGLAALATAVALPATVLAGNCGAGHAKGASMESAGAKAIACGSPSQAINAADAQLAGDTQQGDAAMQGRTVADWVAENPKFSTLWTAIQTAGLQEALRGDGPFTLYAPTNDAFAALPPGTLEELTRPENREKLAGILKYHVIAAAKSCDQACQKGSLTTLQGQSLKAERVDDGRSMINGASVVLSDLPARNGMVHVIDRVLLPEG